MRAQRGGSGTCPKSTPTIIRQASTTLRQHTLSRSEHRLRPTHSWPRAGVGDMPSRTGMSEIGTSLPVWKTYSQRLSLMVEVSGSPNAKDHREEEGPGID